MAHSNSLVGSDRGLHIAFLGDGQIGQSTLLKYFRNEGFSASEIIKKLQTKDCFSVPEHQSYILDQVVDGEAFRIRITDSGGLPVYDKVRKPIIKTAHVIVLCFSTANRKSLEAVRDRWLPYIKTLAHANEEEAPFLKPYVLLGLQTDLRNKAGKSEAVSEDEGTKLAEQWEAMSYLECSIHDPPQSLEKLRIKLLQFGKESYLFRWNQKRIKRSLRGQSDQFVAEDMGTADVDRYAEEALTVEEDFNPLQKGMVVKNLSCLGTTANLRHAYLQVDLPNAELTSCDVLRTFPYLQYVDLSNNNLRSLEPLGELPFLLRLDASRNQIVRTQSFGPPRHLEVVDLSYNLINDLGDWRCHKMLRELNLRGNFIQEIDGGLRRNMRLRMLDLSENHIQVIRNIEHLAIEALYLAQNQLRSLSGIEGLTHLSVLNVRGNLIWDTTPLSRVPNLRKLCLTENRIKAIIQIENLPKSLTDLFITPNPVSDLPYFRLQVLRRQPQLRLLDDVAATAQEKVKANVAYGDDLVRQEEIFNAILPREQFIDRRLITQEAIEKRELEMFGFIGRTAPEDDPYENEEED